MQRENLNQILQEVKKAVYGKDDVLEMVLTCILAQGHILLDDIPGVGKTTMAMAFSKAMELEQKRIQFTPDVMPSDVTGFTMLDKAANRFVFRKGAVFCNLLLADEINRTSARTQSALLEAMEEYQVTVEGKVFKLPKPFIVIATQNPTGSAGTHMLPESQLDRFCVKISMGYPSVEDEILLLKKKSGPNPLLDIHPVISAEMLERLSRESEQVFIHDSILSYIARMAAKSRINPHVALGISPRGSLALCRMARAFAFLQGDEYVTPDHIRHVIKSVWNHRILLKNEQANGYRETGEVIDELLDTEKIDVR